MDLERDPQFQALGVSLVSIAIDPLPDLVSAVQAWGIATPLLSDEDSRVSRAYGVLRWAMPDGEPGHTFVLVDKDGKVQWIKDYGARENGGLMYVPVPLLYQEIAPRLTPSPSSR